MYVMKPSTFKDKMKICTKKMKLPGLPYFPVFFFFFFFVVVFFFCFFLFCFYFFFFFCCFFLQIEETSMHVMQDKC